MKPPEREKPAEDGLTLEEISRLLDVAESAVKPALQTCSPAAWWRAILVFGYNTGLRRGSLLALRRSWIRVCGEGGVLALPARASKKGLPKQIWVSAEAMAAIAELATGDLVFPWPESAASFDRHRRRLWQRAGVDPAHTFHGLRKAIGSELWSIDPKAAQLQLGHAAESTTRRHYVSQAAADASLARNLGPASRRVRQPKAGGGQLSLF